MSFKNIPFPDHSSMHHYAITLSGFTDNQTHYIETGRERIERDYERKKRKREKLTQNEWGREREIIRDRGGEIERGREREREGEREGGRGIGMSSIGITTTVYVCVHVCARACTHP